MCRDGTASAVLQNTHNTYSERERERKKGNQTHKQTDRQTDRRTDNHKEKGWGYGGTEGWRSDEWREREGEGGQGRGREGRTDEAEEHIPLKRQMKPGKLTSDEFLMLGNFNSLSFALLHPRAS